MSVAERTTVQHIGQSIRNLTECGDIADPCTPPQMGGPDMQFVTVMADRRVHQRCRIALHPGRVTNAIPGLRRCDAGMESAPESAPCGVEKEIPLQGTLSGKDCIWSPGILGDEHIGVQKVAVYEISPLGTGMY
jgi:hypothetical protein